MKFEVYRASGEFRWRLRADNNKIIADSGESYHNKQDCLDAVNLVKSTTASTPVSEQT